MEPIPFGSLFEHMKESKGLMEKINGEEQLFDLTEKAYFTVKQLYLGKRTFKELLIVQTL